MLTSFFALVTTAFAGYEQAGEFAGGGPGPGGSGSADGQLSNPNQDAVDDTSGKIYVADTGNNRVEVFKPNATGGEYDSQLAIAAPTGVAIDQSNGDLYVANASGVSKFDSSLNPKAGWSAPSASGPLAVDPTNGDLLVADRDAGLVRRFGSDGTAKGSFAAQRPLSVAVNSSGEIFVVTSSGEIMHCNGASTVRRFSPAGVQIGTVGASLVAPGTVTVDPDNDSISVAAVINTFSCFNSNGPFARIYTFASDGTQVDEFQVGTFANVYAFVPGLAAQGGDSRRLYAVVRSPGNEGFSLTQILAYDYFSKPAIAMDPVDGATVSRTGAQFSGTVNPHGFATEWHFEYSSDGSTWTETPTQNAGAGTSPVPVSATVSGLQAQTTYQVRLVAGNSEGSAPMAERSFTTGNAVKEVQTSPPTNLTTSSGTMTGKIVPGGVALSECKFEYGDTESLGQSIPCAESTGAIGSGEAAVTVHAGLSGLSAGAHYYRLVGVNSFGTTEGSIELLPMATVPEIVSRSVAVEATAAYLKARINPHFGLTKYRFEYGTTAAYGEQTTETAIDPGGNPVLVSQRVEGLQPGTTYHYRLLVSNLAGDVTSVDGTFTTDAAEGQDTCSNAPIRAEQSSAYLPECRAYEQVSAEEKYGKDVFVFGIGWIYTVGTDEAGNAATYQSNGAFADAQNANSIMEYITRRGATGWSTHAVSSKSYLGGPGRPGMEVAGWADDLSAAAVFGLDEALQPGQPPLAPGATPGHYNIYRDDFGSWPSDSFAPVTLDPGGSPPSNQGGLYYVGGSADLSTIGFEDSVPHAANAPAGVVNPYLWHDGQVELVSVLPNGTVAPEATFGAGWGRSRENAISKDGTRAFFSTPDGRIYMRKNGSTTVEVSTSQKSTPDPHQPATYQTATPDGRYVFFTTEEQLLDSDTDAKKDIYRYDTDTGNLIRISAGATNPEYFGVWSMAGASDDGSYVYFTAVFADYGGPHPKAENEVFEVYVWHDGQIHFVGNAGGSENTDLAANNASVQVTPDGKAAAFVSEGLEPKAGEFDPQNTGQIYLYHAPSDTLECASCRTDGKVPTGSAFMPARGRSGIQATAQFPVVDLHSLTDDGQRVFFTSPDPLVHADSNGKPDAYEYVNGKARLISSGISHGDSAFLNATPDGRNVFFSTIEPLVRRDTDQNVDVYVARVDGGFSEPPPTVPCTGEACKGPASSPPQQESAGSAQFSGPESAQRMAPKKKHKAKKHKAKKRHHAKRHAKKSKGGRAGR